MHARALQRRHAHAFAILSVLKRDQPPGLHAGRIRVKVHWHALMQYGEFAGDRRDVGGSKVNIDRKRLVLALPGRRDEPLEQHLALNIILQRHHIDRHPRARGGGNGLFDVAAAAVAVPYQQHAVHRVFAQRRQSQLDGAGDVRAIAQVANRAGVQSERGVGDGVNERLAVEADHADAIVGLLQLRVGCGLQVIFDRPLQRFAGERFDIERAVADVAQHHDIHCFVNLLPSRPGQDEYHQQQHRQPSPDRHPPADGAQSHQRTNAQQHHRRCQ